MWPDMKWWFNNFERLTRLGFVGSPVYIPKRTKFKPSKHKRKR